MPPPLRDNNRNDLPLPDLDNSDVINHIGRDSQKARDYALAVRRESQKLLYAGKTHEALTLIDKIIFQAESLLLGGGDMPSYPCLRAFQIHLQEIRCRIVNQLPRDKQTQLLIDESISAIKTAYEQSINTPGLRDDNRMEILTQWANLTTRRVCNEDTINCTLEDIQYILKGLQELGKKKRKRRNIHCLITKDTNIRIAVNKTYWEIGKKQRSLYCALEAKKILVLGLEKWIQYLNPTLNSEDSMLEYIAKPIAKNWRKLAWGSVEEEINIKIKIEHTSYGKSKWVLPRVEETKSKLFELLLAVAKVYSRLGHHTHAQHILEITNTYGFGISGDLSQRLEYICDMVEIEENKNLLKALDRLESILPEIIHSKNRTKIRRLDGHIHDLYWLYKRIRTEDIANQLLRDFEKEVPSRSKKKSLGELINSVDKELKTERPTKIISIIIEIIKYLRKEANDISSYSVELNMLIAAIAKFRDEWIQHSELQRKENLEYSIGVNLPSLCSRLDYAEMFSHLAISLCNIFNHALLPRLLRHLSRVQRNLDKQSWIETAIESCLKADEFSDPVNFLKSFYMIKGAIENGIEITILEYRRGGLFMSAISVGEKIMQRNVFRKERIKICDDFSPIVDFATLELAKIAINNNYRDIKSWVFRGANLMKSRALTGLTLELLQGTEFNQGEDHLELKEIQIMENEQAMSSKTSREDAEHDNDLYQKKYELYAKIKDKLGIGNCNPENLMKVLTSYKPKKVSVVSFRIFNDKLLVTGVRNYGETWFKLCELNCNIKSLSDRCWQDIEFVDGSVKHLQKAFTTLISPLNENIKDSDLLYIIPDDKSYNLPFHAFYSEEEKMFLIEKYEIAYIPSPLMLEHMPKTRPMYRDSMAIACLGKDIEWERRQAELSKLGIKTSDKPGKGLEELSKKDSLKMLYLLGHGHLSQKPFDANIILKDDEVITYKVTAGELLRWKVKVDFVFLNSCSIGSGDAYGKDIYGFPFCIMGAGNASCLVAAIPVDIKFANLFAKEIFGNLQHNAIDRTTAIAKAIRKTITSTLGSNEWRHPYYWAPYFFYGDFRPLYLN